VLGARAGSGGRLVEYIPNPRMIGESDMIKRYLLLLLLVSSFGLAEPVQAAPPAPRILVKYRSQVETGVRGLASASAQGLAKLGVVELAAPDDATALALLQQLQQDPDVVYAEIDYVRSACQVTPNDFNLDSQWALSAIDLPEAWSITRGKQDILVAVIDSGVALSHPELAGRLVPGWDYVHDDATPEDEHGHGTTVTGVIAANTDNGQQVAGVTWGTRVLPLKVLDQNGDGNDSDVARAIIEAADRGAQVINLSLGGPTSSQTLQEAVDYAHNKGVVIVAASGNEHAPVLYPAACDGVIAVGATREDGGVASFSNYGPELDVVAPGDLVLGISRDGWSTHIAKGTSFAAPHVSGLAALLLSVAPGLANQDVERLITAQAVDQGPAGWDPDYGHGLVNARDSLCALLAEQGAGAVSLAPPGTGSLSSPVSLFCDGSPVYLEVYRDGALASALPLGWRGLELQLPGYLPVRLQAQVQAGSNALGPFDLVYGDMNGDASIDLFDLVLIARNLGQLSSCLPADYDDDGLVTLADLAAAASGYGR